MPRKLIDKLLAVGWHQASDSQCTYLWANGSVTEWRVMHSFIHAYISVRLSPGHAHFLFLKQAIF